MIAYSIGAALKDVSLDVAVVDVAGNGVGRFGAGVHVG